MSEFANISDSLLETVRDVKNSFDKEPIYNRPLWSATYRSDLKEGEWEKENMNGR